MEDKQDVPTNVVGGATVDAHMKMSDAISAAQFGLGVVRGKVDPWVHRSQGMSCQTCMWSVQKGKLAHCRRHAPTMNGYPVVYPTDWCGDHKLDETKV